MSRIKYKPFKYKGKVFILIETEFTNPLGMRYRFEGVKAEIITVNRNMLPHKKQLELHRLITGKRLRHVKFSKRYI